MSDGRASLRATLRVCIEQTTERWFDVDEDELRRYYGDDSAADIAENTQDWLNDNDDLPDWLVERESERDYRSAVTAYDVCVKHGRIKEALYGDRRGESECGGCWLERREAAR